MSAPNRFAVPLGAYQHVVVDLISRREINGDDCTNVLFMGTAPGFVRTESTLTLSGKALRDTILALDTAIDPTTHRALRFFEYLKTQPYSRLEYR